MTTDQLRNVILEAVDCLRQRKCRPDRESIAVFVMRKLGSAMNEIFSEIENIVDLGLLLKVEYKGSTSYRSPKSFDIKNSPLLTKHSKILNSSKTTRYIISGMNELLSNFPTCVQDGIPYEELKNKLIEFDKERFADSGIKVIFEREEAAGNIQVAESEDPVCSTRIFPKDIKVPSDMKLISFIEDANSTPERKKRKRPKKDETESDNSKVRTKEGSSSTEDKDALVYAVKSDPHKVITGNGGDATAKAQQLSTIGLKVVAGKVANACKSNADKSSEKHSFGMTENNDVNNYERKPCLTLINHGTSTSNLNESDNQNGLLEGDFGAGRPGEANSTTQAVPEKNRKKKMSTPADSCSSRTRLVKGKKQRKPIIHSDNDSDDQLTFSQVPPRYTYASKKRMFSSTDSSFGFKRKGKIAINGTDEPRNLLLQSENGNDMDTCVYCRKEENSDGQDFLFCGSCNAKIHPACIDYSEEQAQRLRQHSNSEVESHLKWQCFSCKRCGVCQKALMSSSENGSIGSDTNTKIEEAGKISRKKEQRYILCDQCDRGYHVQCVSGTPPSNASSWFCSECDTVDPELVQESISVGSGKGVMPKTKRRIPVAKRKGQEFRTREKRNEAQNPGVLKNLSLVPVLEISDAETEKNSGIDDTEIPDISSWTPSQVQNYFVGKGLHDEATSLREQEIDGMSLLLLRRADVIFGLNLRLGPALKIYRLVCQLQQHSSALKKKQDGVVAKINFTSR